MTSHAYFDGKVKVHQFDGRVYVSYNRFGYANTLSVCGNQYEPYRYSVK